MKKVLIGTGIALILALALAGYIGSALFYVSSLKTSFLEGDTDKLANEIDFPALRESLKEQLTTLINDQTKSNSDSNQGPFSALTAFIGPTFLNQAVDMYCTPESIGAFVKKNNQVQNKKPSFIKLPSPSDLDWSKLRHFSLTGPTSFRIGTDHITLFVRLEGFSWRLYRLEVSQDFLDEAVKESTSDTK